MEQLVIVMICIVLLCSLYLFLILPRIRKPAYPGASTTLYAHRGLHDRKSTERLHDWDDLPH